MVNAYNYSGSYIIIVLFACIFLIWIVLTIVKQFDKSVWGLNKYDAFALIPNWTLFAPNPKYSDYKIFYRDKTLEQGVTGLQPIEFRCSSPVFTLWKGQCREQKFLTVLCKDIKRKKQNKINSIRAYDAKMKMFKNFCRHYQKPATIVARQVIVIETFGYVVDRREKMIFLMDIDYTHV